MLIFYGMGGVLRQIGLMCLAIFCTLLRKRCLRVSRSFKLCLSSSGAAPSGGFF